MKLYWGPFTCAIEIAALLDEAGVAYEAVKVDTGAGEQNGAAFRAINPKGKIPVLVRDDGAVITEFPAIALWIAGTHPEAGLWPSDPEAALKASEMMFYTIGTLHGQGFRRIFFPKEFCKDEAQLGAVKADGRAMATEGFEILAAQLGERPYAAGDAFSIADATIFYATRWAKLTKVPLPASIEALASRGGVAPGLQGGGRQSGVIVEALRASRLSARSKVLSEWPDQAKLDQAGLDQATSNRSRFITLVQAATKSRTNAFCASSQA